jgi:glutamate racemase
MQSFSNIHVDYLGDLANLPYGTKSPEIVRRLTLQNFQTFLSKHKETYDLAIMACNTASSHALESVQAWLKPLGIPTIGVIDPSVNLALKLHQKNPNKRIIVLCKKNSL